MKLPHLIFTLLTLALCVSCGKKGEQTEEREPATMEDVVAIRYEYGIAVDSFDIVEGRVKSGQTLSKLLTELGATRNNIAQLTTLPDSVFNARSFRAGNDFLAVYTKESTPTLEYFVYRVSHTQSIVLHLTDSLHVDRQEKEITTEGKVGSATINSSLWNAITENNLPIGLALELSEIYAWTVDFFGLQKNDAFTVYYDELYVDSTSIGVGQIYAASFQNGGKTIYAIYFEKEDLKGYFDEEGNSLQKAFLKAPLNFKRISSHFSYARKHPIYKTVRPHTGVDYAAPMGTPIVSIGDGVVTEKGYKGGGGHTVKIKHNSSYSSAYLHLSKYGQGVQVGARVKQGQIIGYVGSSGSSTGPHLDFRVWFQGKPINPLTMESPPIEPVPTRYKAEFDSIKSTMMEKIGVQ